MAMIRDIEKNEDIATTLYFPASSGSKNGETTETQLQVISRRRENEAWHPDEDERNVFRYIVQRSNREAAQAQLHSGQPGKADNNETFVKFTTGEGKPRRGIPLKGAEMFYITPGSIRSASVSQTEQTLNKWTNVTAEVSHLLFPFSVECSKKKVRKLPKSLVVKPVIITIVMSPTQVTISVYPLKAKRAEEVATKMLEIFLMSSAPSILQSDNNQEFSNAIIVKLKSCWPELRLVSGRPQHPQSHGAVERLNGVVQDKSAILM
ncbi:SCAN domain-containing protein 3 [Trichinella patagoniensis]|uniref:SCAN domain-containing protein 3 n=1 Tax=Trichinella patagoniensis TaxID=990121 RepID=A0A0V0Z8S2_9BILA|nr:SCAN domain-containing protein 3 [Trichinella patagoniensis]KRY08748.1 SCAN domain-containing protein 3 [Trichinella patagoniensis]